MVLQYFWFYKICTGLYKISFPKKKKTIDDKAPSTGTKDVNIKND